MLPESFTKCFPGPMKPHGRVVHRDVQRGSGFGERSLAEVHEREDGGLRTRKVLHDLDAAPARHVGDRSLDVDEVTAASYQTLAAVRCPLGVYDGVTYDAEEPRTNFLGIVQAGDVLRRPHRGELEHVVGVAFGNARPNESPELRTVHAERLL